MLEESSVMTQGMKKVALDCTYNMLSYALVSSLLLSSRAPNSYSNAAVTPSVSRGLIAVSRRCLTLANDIQRSTCKPFVDGNCLTLRCLAEHFVLPLLGQLRASFQHEAVGFVSFDIPLRHLGGIGGGRTEVEGQ